MVLPSLPYQGIARRALRGLRPLSITYDREIDISAVIITDQNLSDIDIGKMVQLDKINPKFRHLTDLMLFSDRMDLDFSEFKTLLRENHSDHFEYLWNRFKRASTIFWEEGEKFWFSRINFLYSLGDKSLNKSLEEHFQKGMVSLLRSKHLVDIRYDIEFLQFLEYCKVKHSKQESLVQFKTYLTDIPSHLNAEKIIKIVNHFIPIVFSDINEYVGVISKKITQSSRHYDLLLALEQQGVPFNKEPIIKLGLELITERTHNDKNRRAFFAILNDGYVRSGLKDIYKNSYRDKLLEFIEDCDYQVIEEHHLRNIKNIIDLDSSVADDLAMMYADKLYHRNTGHKKANADRLIRLMKVVPEVNPKKVLAYLSSNNKMSDIKYVLSAFPELRKLAAFV